MCFRGFSPGYGARAISERKTLDEPRCFSTWLTPELNQLKLKALRLSSPESKNCLTVHLVRFSLYPITTKGISYGDL